jgi:hypothetical protein
MSAFSQGLTAGIDKLMDPAIQANQSKRAKKNNLELIKAQGEGAAESGAATPPNPFALGPGEDLQAMGGINPFSNGQMTGGTDTNGMPIDPKMLMQFAPMLLGMPPMVG